MVRDTYDTWTRAGARAAVLQPEDAAAQDAAVSAAAGLDPADLAVSISRTGSRGSPVTVDVTYDDPIRVPFVGWLLGTSVRLDASAVMRQEYA